MNAKPVVVVGSGPSGLMQALFLASVCKRRVLLLEEQPTMGGMFAGIDTPWGVVDQGIHLIQETGAAEWDQLFFEILPPEEWNVFAGVRRTSPETTFRDT